MSSHEISKHDLELAIMKERWAEMKSDKEKSNRQLYWAGGIVFTIMMSVAGFLIQTNADVQVLQEKVMEQKDEINKLNIYIQDVDANLRYELDDIENKIE